MHHSLPNGKNGTYNYKLKGGGFKCSAKRLTQHAPIV